MPQNYSEVLPKIINPRVKQQARLIYIGHIPRACMRHSHYLRNPPVMKPNNNTAKVLWVHILGWWDPAFLKQKIKGNNFLGVSFTTHFWNCFPVQTNHYFKSLSQCEFIIRQVPRRMDIAIVINYRLLPFKSLGSLRSITIKSWQILSRHSINTLMRVSWHVQKGPSK